MTKALKDVIKQDGACQLRCRVTYPLTLTGVPCQEKWQKDHMFNLYLNAFPVYIYGGEVPYNSGPLQVDRASNTGVFVELGFIRSFDFFAPR